MTNINKKFQGLIQTRATRTYAAHEFVQEYGFFIALVLLVKLSTSLFSAYAGYYYLKSLFVEILENQTWAIVFTVISLVFIEFLTNISLSKFYKTSLRGNMKAAAGFVLLSFVFFGLQFYTSANGLAQRQAQRADNTAVILDKFDIQVSELKKQAENSKNEAKQAIEIIRSNPSGWRNSKRDVLQPDQLAAINGYYSKIEETNNTLRLDIDKIEGKKADELKANSGNVLIVEKRFYNTTSGVMAIQLFVNGLIMFFYSKIYADKHKEQLAKEVVQTFAADISDTTDQLIKLNISNSYHNYLSALSFQLSENDNNKAILPKLDKSKKIGFKNDNDVIHNYDSIITNDDNESNEVKTTHVMKYEKEMKTCKRCGNEYKPYNVKQIFCSSDCRLNWHKQNNGFELDKYLKRKH